jgi:ketosteroid isomerase-like protein
MSRENVELLVQGYRRFSERDPTVFADLLVTDFVYRPRAELPGNQPTAGRDRFEQTVRDLWAVFDPLRFDVVEVRDHGDVILAVIHQTGRGHASGVAIDQHVTHVWRIEDGRASELDVYSERAEALEAVGQRE